MRELIADLPDQLRWAADSSHPRCPPATEVLVAGMGGSGIAGDIAGVIAEGDGAGSASTSPTGCRDGWERLGPLILVGLAQRRTPRRPCRRCRQDPLQGSRPPPSPPAGDSGRWPRIADGR